MVLQPRLDMRQTQGLVMTPQLQQAIKLLQLSNLELGAWIEQELERNPLLERAEPSVAVLPESDVPVEYRRDAGQDVLVDPIDGAREAPLDVEVDNTFDEGSPREGPAWDPDEALGRWDRVGHGGRGDFSDNEMDHDRQVSAARSLRDHILEQVELDIPDPVDRLVAVALLDALDDNGWLLVPTLDIADGLGTSQEHVEAVLRVVQRFDPPGLFSRSLKECLALQLADRDRLDPAMESLVDNLDLLARRDFATLMRICGVDETDLQDMITEIRALDPKPAQHFDAVVAPPVVPDVLMRPLPDGGWIVELNPDTLPKVLVNSRYYARVSKAALSKEEKAFVTENFQSASWLVKSLDQRANTILKVSTEIVRRQHRFFEEGVSGLRPLILRDIAEAVDMHESTVSRVTNNKYLSTPRGVYELKYFFTQAISTTDGRDSVSAEAVRLRIKSLIDGEEPGKVLSDDALVAILQAEGIDIARRTVAKYRESMKIPSSVQRRREKFMGGSPPVAV
ncbi:MULTISPECIES: RNA polymerase factor sigma-54 [unclassified Haematospirillum]|uniref:RNA polymerase factor sigma-54 n=1 Tax=unclassified Haematospirillum TaxID=2622088 RepID=UPI00143C9D75|nr:MULTISPECIES: RNA polymerase factor sigma-54 [unclassified Haematospirillum]NKD55696.1 RNA polymerase factor sigma-54 [Haematospirillum sp. H4890]NKD75221.1 RNA polymerase factor sigma-54 [Haematospirillum sp. H4485]